MQVILKHKFLHYLGVCCGWRLYKLEEQRCMSAHVLLI